MLYVVRHGQSTFNRRGLICGRSNAPLTDIGREQARVAGERLRNIKFDYAFSSPLDRARETAEIILSQNEHKTPDLVINEHIIERDAGLLEGEQLDLPGKRIPSWAPDFNCEECWYETRESVVERVRAFLSEIGEIYKDKNVLVVAHNGIVRGFRHIFEGLPFELDWLNYGVENAGFVVYGQGEES